jgi:hypothetical protein
LGRKEENKHRKMCGYEERIEKTKHKTNSFGGKYEGRKDSLRGK